MKVNIDGLNISYVCEGEGKNVLLLHGWGANITTMLPILNHLKDRFKVYAIDLPGFGESDKPKEIWGNFEYADIVKKFIDKMEMKEVILIGHSHGGRISIILSNRYPELVKKMVLIDSAGLIPKRSMKYYLKVYSFKTLKFLYNTMLFWTNKEERMEKFYKKFGSTDYRAADGIMRKIMVKVINQDLRPLLKGIKASTLLVWGKDDTATPVYMGKIMEKEIKDSGLVVLENAGHYSYVDQYNRFKLILDSFLKD
ncbi:alpha/beta fold hydrolase [Caldisalinibacter kiritimatiensis]|uniref:3-Oxoadipate enol-lactonase, alpha/beta hydrolase fold family n=1 Tax=Caldisalinibacter kiritimatiensis TaxID=1304284 RepID=R1CVU2_9FIRM|nr:alpha/beta hydrolase [Caldisalinibacter kiritimatiensis]EOD00759.1 3-Oxoadipate enol-lactonase, alpha/beta hydrolase fold family [Caldisalinibacter kiritimatiensis]